MKKFIYNISVITLIAGALFSCDNENLVYNEKDGVYFVMNESDSIYYSFLGKLNDTDTLKIPIQVMGDASNMDRNYTIEIDEVNTTAQEGLHYKKLETSYVFGADKFQENFELILYKDDPALLTENRVVTLKLIESNDFNLGYTDKTSIKVYITNQLIKPSYWDDLLYLYFGEYSQVKHNMAINLMGHDFPFLKSEATSSSGDYGYQYWMVQGRALAAYFIDNEVYDENGNRIYPWSVF